MRRPVKKHREEEFEEPEGAEIEQTDDEET
jgi:hypothetical protein